MTTIDLGQSEKRHPGLHGAGDGMYVRVPCACMLARDPGGIYIIIMIHTDHRCKLVPLPGGVEGGTVGDLERGNEGRACPAAAFGVVAKGEAQPTSANLYQCLHTQ